MSPPRVVITDCDHDSIEPERAVLAAAGLDVRLAECRSSQDVVTAAAGAEAIIVQYAPVDRAALAGLERCRVIARYGVGVDTIDVDAATERGVWVANVPDYGTEEVSDHALALSLALLRGLPRLDRSVRAGRWDVTEVAPLRRMNTLTVGVLGTGRIGAAFARKIRPLVAAVLAHDPGGVPDDLEADGIVPASRANVLARSDILSLHVPLTPEMHHLIGREALAAMPAGAVLVNSSRGGLVDGGALLAALEGGHLGGAALDVLETEPPASGDLLLRHDRVLVTPHAAWYSEQSALTLKQEAAREVVRVLSGDPPRSPVNAPRAPVGGPHGR